MMKATIDLGPMTPSVMVESKLLFDMALHYRSYLRECLRTQQDNVIRAERFDDKETVKEALYRIGEIKAKLDDLKPFVQC